MNRSPLFSCKLLIIAALFPFALPFRAQASKYALAASTQANHSAANLLGSTSVLSGNAYVFTSSASIVGASPAGITQVCYWLDRAATGTADHCEGGSPYDLKGSTSTSCGLPWNTATVPDGWHTLTQIVILATGGTETDVASFRTYNGSQLTVNAAYDDGTQVAGTVVLQSLSANGTAVTLATMPLSTGSA